jgi:hypothetical protein
MPSWQWSYPFDDNDEATLLFDAAPANALHHWMPPYGGTPAPRQTLVETADGGIRVYTTGPAGGAIELQFTGLPTGDCTNASALTGFAGLVRFLAESTGYSARSFGFYDQSPDAEEVEVRYMGGIETFQQDRGRWSGTIRLRKEIA